MIKFFRRIRKSLIEKNEMVKYFKYAIGEILLVVIGILIALQINNWNENRKSKEKERLALIEIISDLDYSIKDLERVKNSKYNSLLRNINAQKTLIKVLQSNAKYHDSLARYFSYANSYDVADFKISGYNSLSSSGLDIIQNSKIRSSIGQFYTSNIADYKEAFKEVLQDFHEYMLDYMRKDFTYKSLAPINRELIPNDYEALKNDKVYIQSLRTFLDVNNYYLKKLNMTLKNAVDLKQDIEDYIHD